MDATSVIIECHADLERALADYDQAEGSPRRQIRALRAIAGGLAVHAAVEDEILYPAIRELTGRYNQRIVRHLEQTHVLELLLVELGGMLPADRHFDAKVGLLGELFRQHARDQEADLLPQLRRRMEHEDRVRLGKELLERMHDLKGVPAR
jgi:Hemerythrin HHE cation binding domain